MRKPSYLITFDLPKERWDAGRIRNAIKSLADLLTDNEEILIPAIVKKKGKEQTFEILTEINKFLDGLDISNHKKAEGDEDG